VDRGRCRLRRLLFEDDERYRQEAETTVPTTLDRLAENRERLKHLKDRKERERLELVQQKYLQQAAYAGLTHGPRKWEGGQEGPAPPPPIPLGAIHVIGPSWKMLNQPPLLPLTLAMTENY